MHPTMTSVAETGIDGLSFLWLEITGKCNLTCTHCYADSSPTGDLYGDMTYEDWVRVLDDAAELGCRRVQFIGGEPTMHPRLHELVDHANHRHYKQIEVYTNATRLGRELLGCFQRNGVQIATSFYSEEPSVHERITQVAGSWERTVEGIRRVLEARLPLRVGVVETTLSQGHHAGAIEFLKRMGIKNISIDRERGVGRSGLFQVGGQEEQFDQLCGQCWRGKLCVVPTGDCFPCVFSRATNLGSVKAGILSVLQSDKLRAFRERVRQTEQGHCDPIFCHPNGIGCDPEAAKRCDPDCTPNGPCGPNQCKPDTPRCDPTECGPQGNCGPDCNPNDKP